MVTYFGNTPGLLGTKATGTNTIEHNGPDGGDFFGNLRENTSWASDHKMRLSILSAEPLIVVKLNRGQADRHDGQVPEISL